MAAPCPAPRYEAVAQLAAFVDSLDKNPLSAPDSDATVNTMEATAIIQQLVVEQPDWDTLTAMLTPAMTTRDGTLMAKRSRAPPTCLRRRPSKEWSTTPTNRSCSAR